MTRTRDLERALRKALEINELVWEARSTMFKLASAVEDALAEIEKALGKEK